MKVVICLTVMMAGLSTAAAAQQVSTIPTDDPVESARLHFGPVGLNPRVGLKNIGVDTNVFNEVDDPKQDFTFTVAPGTGLFLRTGRGLFSFDGNLEFVYFNEFESERSVNSNATGQYEFRFNRLRPYFSARTLNTRERPGYEIDARARHYETDFHAGNDFRVASKSTLRLDFRHLDYQFAGDEVFNGQALYQELNRTLKAVELGWRQRLTALTTWVASVSRESERFEFEDGRNSDSFRLWSGFELGRLALIRGTALVGFRKLTPADGGIFREFSGITSNVNVSYTLPTQTRLTGQVLRDVQYSYERNTPYYLQTGWSGTLTQRVGGSWDVQVTGSRDRLAYEALLPRDARTDHFDRFGGGVGYTLGDLTRISFDLTSFYRSSIDPRREYGGIRGGVSVSYGY